MLDFSNYGELDWLKLNKGQADIHMMALAEAMWDAYNESQPKQLKAGEWHIPFENKIKLTENWDDDLESYLKGMPIFDQKDIIGFSASMKLMEIKISTTMNARVSYTVVGEDQKPLSYKRMLEIHDELLKANPKHMSPFEHCARAMSEIEHFNNVRGERIDYNEIEKGGEGWSGNFRGFMQYRKMIKGENITI